MPNFCHQISFTTSAWPRVLESDDCFEAVRAPIESLGGRIRAAFFAVDSFDVLVLSEFPDHISATDIAVQFSGGGQVAHVHTTQLLGASDALEALHKSGPHTQQTVPRPQSFSVSTT